jgi:xylulokinase
VVSLGTSDTVLLATEKYNPHPNYHIFPHPAGNDKTGGERYMGM